MNTLHYIQYNFLLGERPKNVFPDLGIEELLSFHLIALGLYPQSFEHLVYGCNYYQSVLNRGVNGGYKVAFIYADSIEVCGTLPALPQESTYSVYFICTQNNLCLDVIFKTLKRKHSSQNIYVANDIQRHWLAGMENVFSNSFEVITFLKKIAPVIIDIGKDCKPYYVPPIIQLLDKGLMFNPTIPNTLTGHSMLGDWGFRYNVYSDVEKREESKKAFDHSEEFLRQGQIIKQIKVLDTIENAFLSSFYIARKEQIKAPLICVLPFTNNDLRQRYAKTYVAGHEEIQKAVKAVLSQRTSPNYIGYSRSKDDSVNLNTVSVVYQLFFGMRSRFLDIIGGLHASFRFSPYIRLPYQGPEINRELSFVSPQRVHELMQSKKKDSYEKVMIGLGEKIVENTLSIDAQEMLKEMPRQIVAITDLPIEWLLIDGVPLGFTHDICKIAEFPLEGNLMHYVVNEIGTFVIPQDILHRTLIIYGVNDNEFKYYQEICDEEAESMGYHTATCKTKEEFAEIVKAIQPLLLIVDTHGGYDEKLHQTFIYVGDDKIYPNDIVRLGIHVPLVFLSACVTAPTYNMVNTLANGFVESGSLAVTSSYMPLSVKESSLVYLRIILLLKEAAEKPIHRNWLSFVSHVLRTSYLHEAFEDYYKNTNLSTMEDAAKYESVAFLNRSMFFHERRKLYIELKKGITMEGIRTTIMHKIPHYLMYTTIGRADLVCFQSYIDWIDEKINN